MGRGDWWAIAHGGHKIIRHDLANKQHSIVYMYNNFYIHSSVNGHLVSFHVQATINSTAMNIGVFIIFKCIVSWYWVHLYYTLAFWWHNGCWQFDLWFLSLPFLNPAWTSGSSQFMYYWSLAWRILNITLLACGMSAIVW